jgi:hypothetical protein
VKFSVRPSILLNNRECSRLGVNEGVNTSPRGQISVKLKMALSVLEIAPAFSKQNSLPQ